MRVEARHGAQAEADRKLLLGEDDKFEKMVRKTESALDAFSLAMANINDVMGDPNARAKLKETLNGLPDVIADLRTTVKGIGVWSAHMHLIFHRGRLDVLPVGDLGLRMAAAKVYGLSEPADPKELTRIAEPWRPYRSLGSWYLWRALDGGGV